MSDIRYSVNKGRIRNSSANKDIVEKVCFSLNKYSALADGNVVAVLYSSGSDSTTLLHILNAIVAGVKAKQSINVGIVIIHVNYNLRGEDSIADRDFAIQQANKLGCKIFIKEVDKSIFDKGNLQQKARNIRYRYARSLYEQKVFTHLLVAHNKNDYIETVLYKLIKGTSTRLPYSFKERVGYIIRPMLDVSKDEINNYINNNGITYRLDKSNNKNKYSRNKIRNIVLPALESISNNSIDNIADFLTLMKCELEPLEQRALHYCKKHTSIDRSENKIYSLGIEHIGSQHKTIIFRIIAKFISKASNIRISKKIIEEVYKIVISSKPNISIIIEGYKLEKAYNALNIYKHKRAAVDGTHSAKIVVQQEGQYSFYGKEIIISIVNKNCVNLKDGAIYLDIDFPFTIRNRANADVIHTYPNGNTKSLREIFIDAKIPIKIREKIPIIECKREIVAVAIGFYSTKYNRISCTCSIDKNSSDNIIRIDAN